MVRIIAAVAASVLLVGCAAGRGGPGSVGVGDPYAPDAGNGGYHVIHYDLDLAYQPKGDDLSGVATLLAKATQDLNRFNLDFALRPARVRVNDEEARFRQEGTELVVTPKHAVTNGSAMRVVVAYAGSPSKAKDTGWVITPTGTAVVSGQEFSAARGWFPSNDHTSEKATYDIAIRAPKGLTALSNGRLIGVADVKDGGRQWRWRMAQPMAACLAFAAIGRFQVTQHRSRVGQQVVNAYETGLDRQTAAAAKASVERTEEVVAFLASAFGTYPFDALGGVVINARDDSLENQSRPVYRSDDFTDGPNVSLIVHENAHQWFGDSVSLGRLSDIWLNEGFATYAEWLWAEHAGEKTVQQSFAEAYTRVPPSDTFWQVKPGDPGPTGIFDDAVYDRGAMTLQVLRHAMGDGAFFEMLRTWATTRKYGDGTTKDFIQLADAVSGKKLDNLFQAWLYTPGKPTFGVPGKPAAAATRT